MSHLTVTEKEHWKERISRRIDKVIEATYAEHPGLKARVAEAARADALNSLGLSELQRQLDEIAESEKRFQKQKEAAHKEMLAIIKGVAVADFPAHNYHYSLSHEITAAIQRRQAVHEETLLARDSVGKRILALQREKEELLDTVWLATSSKQIKELWQGVAELLQENPTELQAQALRMDSVKGNSTE